MPGYVFPTRPKVFGYKRSPFGRIGGILSKISPSTLAGVVVDAALTSSGVAYEDVSAIIVGHCLTAFCGQHAAQQVVANSTLLGILTPAISLNVVCNSGMEAFIDACRRICIGEGLVYVVVGMENMSQSHAVRRDGIQEVSAIYDGLLDASSHRSMGAIAEEFYTQKGYTREQLDLVAIKSCEAALAWTKPEVVQLLIDQSTWHIYSVTDPDSNSLVSFQKVETKPSTSNGEYIYFSIDDQLMRYNREKLSSLKPCFREVGILTSGTSSAKSDGAASLVLTNHSYSRRVSSAHPVAEVLGYFYLTVAGQEYLKAPISAAVSLCNLLGLSTESVSCVRITEAFAGLVLDIQAVFPTACVNKHGDALAYGHPLAASSCRIIGDLMYDLNINEFGIACACNGGGGGYAICLHRLE